MMKKLILVSIYSILVLSVFTNISYGQSDYETVQNFKRECEDLEQKIKNAVSSEELNLIPNSINSLAEKYSAYSSLIDKALYPEKFNLMISRINESYNFRNHYFIEVGGLRDEITYLRIRIDTLSSLNSKLLADLESMETQLNRNRRENSKLGRTIAELKESLKKRDLLVMNMVDSLLPPIMREKAMLSSEDKIQISSDIERGNILINVKTTMSDNIKYLDRTSLRANDISEILSQQIEFDKTWSKIGPRLLEVYADDKNREKEIREIDSLLTAWTEAVKQEAWESIEEVFASRGVTLNRFSNGEEFTNSVNSYILLEKGNIKSVPENIAKESFELFVDSTWSAEIETNWTPFLIDHGMLAENNKDEIDDNIDIWKSELYPSRWWIWIIILGLLSTGAMFLVKRFKKSSLAIDIAPE